MLQKKHFLKLKAILLLSSFLFFYGVSVQPTYLSMGHPVEEKINYTQMVSKSGKVFQFVGTMNLWKENIR